MGAMLVNTDHVVSTFFLSGLVCAGVSWSWAHFAPAPTTSDGGCFHNGDVTGWETRGPERVTSLPKDTQLMNCGGWDSGAQSPNL